jgi:hypothetical protein
MVFVLHWSSLFLWQQVTHLAAVMHTVLFHPVDMGVYQNWICFRNLCVIWGKYVSLIWSYIWQEVRKCDSVSTSFCGQWAHRLSSLESQVCLRWSFSIARLCSLSLYIVKAFLKFGSVTEVRYSATVSSLFGVKYYSSLLCFVVDSFQLNNNFVFSMISLGLIVLLSWGSVDSVFVSRVPVQAARGNSSLGSSLCRRGALLYNMEAITYFSVVIEFNGSFLDFDN